MRINLTFDNFPFFKICIGSLFLLVALCYPVAILFSSLITLFVGRAHSLGAWFAMWRSGKLNWKYTIWVSSLTTTLVLWGGTVASLPMLRFITYLLFAFHFFFDEFDLQEEKMTTHNVFSSSAPFCIISLYLIKDFFNLAIGFDIFVALFILLLIIEFIYMKEIGWLFIQTKILGAFILCSVFLGITPWSILNVLLLSHYFFWFIFPVYKLHKYKREERDGLIMILILLIATSVFFASSHDRYSAEVLELSIKSFLVLTLVHILSTPPFGYLFGLPRSRAYSS